MCLYTHVFIYIYKATYTHSDSYTYIYIHIYTQWHLHVHSYTYINPYQVFFTSRTTLHIYICVHMYMWWCVNIKWTTAVQTIALHTAWVLVHTLYLHIHSYIHKYTYTQIHMYTYTHIPHTYIKLYRAIIKSLYMFGTDIRYRVAKTPRIPYLYRSFSAKVTYI